MPAKVSVVGDKIFLEYEALTTGYGYIKPIVTLEFGARSTGEPSESRNVVCDAATYLPTVKFPAASPVSTGVMFTVTLAPAASVPEGGVKVIHV